MSLAHKKEPAEHLPTHLVIKEHVANMLGISESQLNDFLGDYVWPKLSYRVIEGMERDDIMLGILERIDAKGMRVVGNNDNEVWIKGWGEILEQVERDGFTPAVLKPQYFDHHRVMRFGGEYIDGGDATFVYQYDQLLRRLVLAKYLKGKKKIVELGCGTGTSQLMLAELLPDAELIASDWSPPSQGIIRAMSAYLKRDIRPACFNMLTLEGWDELDIDADTSVLTVHALEQLGGNCTALMDKLLEAKPEFCLHLEPVVEFYDDTNLFDWLGKRYHKARNYLDGWLTALKEHEKAGRVEILDTARLQFGDRYHEAYSVIAWRPR